MPKTLPRYPRPCRYPKPCPAKPCPATKPCRYAKPCPATRDLLSSLPETLPRYPKPCRYPRPCPATGSLARTLAPLPEALPEPLPRYQKPCQNPCPATRSLARTLAPLPEALPEPLPRYPKHCCCCCWCWCCCWCSLAFKSRRRPITRRAHFSCGLNPVTLPQFQPNSRASLCGLGRQSRLLCRATSRRPRLSFAVRAKMSVTLHVKKHSSHSRNRMS